MKARVLTLIGVFLYAFFSILYTGERFYLWVMMLIASIFVLALLNIACTLLCMKITQSVSPEELTAGEYGKLVISVKNRGPVPLAHIDLWYDTFDTLFGEGYAGAATAAVDSAAYGYVSGVMPGREGAIQGEIYFPYRGRYEPGIIRASLCDVFGLISFRLPQAFFKNRQHVSVLPRRTATALGGLGENPFTGGVSGGREEEEPYSIAEIREFRPGDPLKHVHWKLTARIGKLQVKEFDGALSPRVAVFLDLAPHGLRGERAAALEDCMCRNTAAVCAVALDAHTPMNLVACSEERVTLSGVSPTELIVFRRLLATLRFRCPFDFCDVIIIVLDLPQDP